MTHNAEAGYGQKNVSGRSISARTSSKMTSIAHNNRTPEDDFGDNIDRLKTNDNVILISDDLEDVYHELFHESVLNYNAKQKREDRKKSEEKGGYLKEVKEQWNKSKTGTVDPQREFIVQFGRKQDEPFPEELSNTMFKEYLDDFQERYTDLRVYNAVIHNDEATPHMHVNFVPVADGYTRGLEKRPSFSRVLKKHDVSFTEFFEEEKDKLAEIMKEHTGEERKEVGSHKYLKPAQYREMMSEANEKRREAVTRNVASFTRREELDNRESILNDKDVDLKRKAQNIKYVINDVQQREKGVSIKEKTLNERESALQVRENKLLERENNVSDKAERLNEQQNTLNVQKTAIDAREAEIKVKDRKADDKLSEASEKDKNADEKLKQAKEYKDDGIFKLAENEKRLAEIRKESEELRKLKESFKQFGDKIYDLVDKIRKGEIGKRGAKRVTNELKTPLDTQENLDHNNQILDEFNDGFLELVKRTEGQEMQQ